MVCRTLNPKLRGKKKLSDRIVASHAGEKKGQGEPKLPHQNLPLFFPFFFPIFFLIVALISNPTFQMPSHYGTPQRPRCRELMNFFLQKAFPSILERFFSILAFEARDGYKIIRNGAASRRRHHSTLVETCGRKSKVTEAQIQEADHILQDEGLQLEGKRYTWEQLAMEIGADVVGRTMHNVMSAALNYEKCLACVMGWLADPPMERRVEFAHMMLTNIPNRSNGIAYDLVMRFILDMGRKDSYESFVSPEHDIVGIAYSIVTRLLRKIENENIAGLQLATISSRILSFMTCRATAMVK